MLDFRERLQFNASGSDPRTRRYLTHPCTCTGGNPMRKQNVSVDDLCVNTIRTLAMDMVEAAKSGHPGAPMGLAPAAYVLFTRVLRHNPCNPAWPNRDRFVLSGGHASMLLVQPAPPVRYDLPLDELKQFRQWGSKTPGHPEYRHTRGSRPRPARWGRASAMPSGWRLPSGTWRRATTRAVAEDRGPLHLRLLRRRRPHGGRGLRSGLARGPPRAGQV